jgi:hypothetical protein
MTTTHNQDRIAAEVLYRIFRNHADTSGCPTYSWSGMPENFRTAWTLLARSLNEQTKCVAEMAERQVMEK